MHQFICVLSYKRYSNIVTISNDSATQQDGTITSIPIQSENDSSLSRSKEANIFVPDDIRFGSSLCPCLDKSESEEGLLKILGGLSRSSEHCVSCLTTPVKVYLIQLHPIFQCHSTFDTHRSLCSLQVMKTHVRGLTSNVHFVEASFCTQRLPNAFEIV